MTAPSAQHNRHRSGGLLYRLLPLAVLALSLGVTADLWRSGMRLAEQRLQSEFDLRVVGALGLVEERVADYQQVLHGVAGLFASSSQVNRDEFNDYVAALQLPAADPGIHGIGFVNLLGNRTATLAYRAPAANACLPPVGSDLYAEPTYREAMERALTANAVSVTAKMALPDSCGKRAGPGFVMVAPANLKQALSAQRKMAGWIVATIRISDLMAPMPPQDKAELDVEIYDGEHIAGPMLLYDSDNWPMHADPDRGRYRSVRQLRVADHVWTVAVRSLPAFEARLDSSGSIKAWFGSGISILLAVITWQLAGSRARAIEAAREMNQALIERETRYRQIFEDSASIAFLLDPSSGRIVDANTAASAFWGYPVQRLRRMHVEDIDVSAENGIHTLMRTIAAGTASRFECRHRLADGTIRDVVLYAGRLEYEKKVLVHAIVHDITARKQAELALRSSEERYRLIAENTGDVIWMMDAETLCFTYVSPSIERQRGYMPDEIMALHRDVLHRAPASEAGANMPRMAHHVKERIRLFLAGDESQRREVTEIDQRHKDGRIIPVEVMSTLLCDEHGIPRALIGVSRDITSRRQAQEEQKRFVAMVSHEFRTPLATIDGAVQRLLSTSAHADDATRNRYEKIQKAADRLTGLLDDYLTQESIDTVGQGMHLSHASLGALLRDCAASAQAVSAGHVITVDASDLPAAFQCDADRLRLALRILADNAAKYTPPGSSISLAGRTLPDGVELYVSDDGDGIPASEMPHIFDKFFRGRRAAQQAGSGLGLHMARMVVEMHGGTLVASNRNEGGALFQIKIPFRHAPVVRIGEI
ncbi:PAS domain S-box protein [Herbaspirillum sp. HC18]|nr:PAS domain S-box protein [Herbaspirillum sp. HC18]